MKWLPLPNKQSTAKNFNTHTEAETEISRFGFIFSCLHFNFALRILHGFTLSAFAHSCLILQYLQVIAGASRTSFRAAKKN